LSPRGIVVLPVWLIPDFERASGTRVPLAARSTKQEDAVATYMEKSEQQASRAYSPAVITQGGKTVWLAGQTALRDEAGHDLSGDFDAQAKTIFALIGKTLQRAGGSLADMVTMTVFINDPRNGDRFVELRQGFFPDGNFPASAMITVSHFARPGMLIEIQGVAVIGG
jgi:enamine deaminase RidA (YjgF/YER057c/UK114 family)